MAFVGGSSNGRTPDSDSGCLGSNPSPPAILRSFGASGGEPPHAPESQKAGLRLLSNNRSFSPAFWPETTAGGTYPGPTGSSPHLCFVRELCSRDAIPGRHGRTPVCTLTLSVLRCFQPVPVGPILLKDTSLFLELGIYRLYSQASRPRQRYFFFAAISTGCIELAKEKAADRSAALSAARPVIRPNQR